MRLCPCFLDCNTIKIIRPCYIFRVSEHFQSKCCFSYSEMASHIKKNNISLPPNKYRIKQDLISLWQMNDNLYLCKLNMDSIGDGNKCD